MHRGDMIIVPRLSMLTAMAAIEIMDARVDTGIVTDAQRAQPAFDPLRLLPPTEVLYIMDQLLSCEVLAYFVL